MTRAKRPTAITANGPQAGTGSQKLPRVPEKRVQAEIVKLLEQVGSKVYVLGTNRRSADYHGGASGTMQTPGLPDLLAFVPIRHGDGRLRILLCVEVKAQGGRLRPAQVDFVGCCAEADVAHVTGGLDQVLTWLESAPLIHAIRREAAGRPSAPK